MKSPFAASGDQTRPASSGEEAFAACGIARGTGSNSENNIKPARNPPICACQATLAPSDPIAIDPTPKIRLTPNQTARNPSTRVLRKARPSDSAGTFAAASALAADAAADELQQQVLQCVVSLPQLARIAAI